MIDEWTGWRGPRRDAVSASVPRTLPDVPRILWMQPLRGPGLGGVAATRKLVVIGDRGLGDVSDVFHCYSADDGKLLWSIQYPALGKLDYGNTPRATPLIHNNRVYLLGGFGDLHCVELATGNIVWKRNIRIDFGARHELVWGYCSSPLIVDGKLIVNPGAEQASVVALDPQTGKTLWQTPGGPPGYASFIVGRFGGVRQIVGYDKESLGGWNLTTGKRLWKLRPRHPGDFNVPTPVQAGDRLLVATENNGARLYAFAKGGRILAKPIAVNENLAPDMATPLVVNGKAYCVWEKLHCLDLEDGLKTLWTGADDSFGLYGAIVGNKSRILVFGDGGTMVLLDTTRERFRVVSRLEVFQGYTAEYYSHPALVGDRLYLRGPTSLVCLSLETTP